MPDMNWAGLTAMMMVVPGEGGEVRTVPVAVVQMDAGPSLNSHLMAFLQQGSPFWKPVAAPVVAHLPGEARAELYARVGEGAGVSIGSWRDQQVIYDSPTHEIDVPGWVELARADGRVLVVLGLWARGSKLDDPLVLDDCAAHGQLIGAWADLID